MTRSATDICGVGSPAVLFLEQFGSIVWDAFGHPPYLVGSAAKGKVWRDVDVRLMLPDDEFLAMFGKPAPLHPWTSGKWAALCMAFSALGKQLTGLPIDFQIQDSTHANKTYDGPRQAIGLLESRRGETPTPAPTPASPAPTEASGKRDHEFVGSGPPYMACVKCGYTPASPAPAPKEADEARGGARS